MPLWLIVVLLVLGVAGPVLAVGYGVDVQAAADQEVAGKRRLYTLIVWLIINHNELQVQEWTVEDVRGWYQYAGWQTWNAYGEDTTGSNLYTTLSYRQNHDVYASDFWVGDFQGVWE
jgi:hypothetical protein